MVSNTWESGLQVGLLISPLGFPGECHLLHQPSSSTLLSHSHGGFNIACCLLCLLSFPWVGEKKNLLLTTISGMCPFLSKKAMAEENYGKMKEKARKGHLLVATAKCSQEAEDSH